MFFLDDTMITPRHCYYAYHIHLDTVDKSALKEVDFGVL